MVSVPDFTMGISSRAVKSLFGSDSTKAEFERLKPFFAAQGAEDHIFLKTFDGDHEMDPADDCMDFLFAHL